MSIVRSIANSLVIVVMLSDICCGQDGDIVANENIKTETPESITEPEDTTVVSAQEKVSVYSNIILGASLPLSKEGKLIEQGMDIVFRKVNRHGGINNKTLRLLALDDKKEIGESINNVNFLRKKTPFLLNPFTVGLVSEILPLIKEKKVFVWGPEENSDSLYNPDYSYIAHIKPPISSEIDAIISHAYIHLRKRRFAIFYTNDKYGNAGAEQARIVLEKHGLKPIVESSYPPQTVDVQDSAKKIADEHPDAVLCISRRHATYNFILHAVNQGLTQASYLGTSYLLPLQVMLKSARGINFISTATTPDPITSTLPIVDEYRKSMSEYFPQQQLSTISLFSYISASIFVELLQKVSGIPTPEKIVRVMQGLKKYPFGGLTLDFDPNKRTLLENLWISPGYREKWFEVKKEIL
jgi:ABC-type branched-subunit amino acid transport system substrate-binding protein